MPYCWTCGAHIWPSDWRPNQMVCERCDEPWDMPEDVLDWLEAPVMDKPWEWEHRLDM